MTRNLVPAEGIKALIDGWRKEASEFDGLAPLDVATLNRCADDLEEALRDAIHRSMLR